MRAIIAARLRAKHWNAPNGGFRRTNGGCSCRTTRPFFSARRWSVCRPDDISIPALLLQVFSLKFAGTAYLNDHSAFLRSDEVRNTSRNDDETTRRVAPQLRCVKLHSLAQVPSAFDDRNEFVLRVRMRQDTRATGYFHSIDPGATLAGVAEQLRSLSAIVVERGSKPPYFVRR